MPHSFTPSASQITAQEHARKPHTVGKAVMKRVTPMVVSVLLAIVAVVGVSAVNPQPVQATGGAYVKKCGGDTIFLNERETRTFVLHNKKRREHNLKPFCVHPQLQEAARAHSEDMIQREYFSHDTKGGETFTERMKKFGYTSLAGENIAYGSGSYGEPESIMRRWMKSDGHRRNILNAKFREIGVGIYTGEFKGFKGVTMYTVDFGVGQR